MTIVKRNGLTILVPDTGMRLTNGDVIADENVYLGRGANISKWYEISENVCSSEDIATALEDIL